MLIGIVLGLTAATGHSLFYLATRWYTTQRGYSAAQLLTLSHVMLAGFAAAALPWLWPEGLGWEWSWVLPWLGLLVFYLAAQFCIFGALRRTDASRVAPLLSLKVAVLAILSVASGQQLGLLQWAGVGLAVVSAWVLNGAGGHTPWRATVLVLAACVIYAFSDVCIYELLTRVREISGDRSTLGVPLWAFALVCVGVGLLALGALPWLGHRSPTAWRDAVPYALSWTMAMVALYACFAMLGTVLGAILQSTRGLISIGLGVLLAHLGWQHLEQKHGASVVGRRLVAAGLMTAAVALYVWGG